MKFVTLLSPFTAALEQKGVSRFCAAAVEKRPDGKPRFKNGQLVADAVRFMTTIGARIASALAQSLFKK